MMKAPNPTFLDRVIGHFSPEMGVKRLIARLKLHEFRYEGARVSRNRGRAGILESPESSSQTFDRVNLIKEARDLAENDGFVKSILLKMATYVCGSIHYDALTGNDSIDSQYEDYFESWCNTCDITGRHTFEVLMQLAIISTIRDGDMGFVCVNGDKTMQLQAIEADRIGNPYDTTSSVANYTHGISIDLNGRPVSYRIFNRSKENTYSTSIDIPANSFIHFFDPMRSDEYRGRSAFHAAITTLRDIHEILDAERAAVKFAAYQTALVTTRSGAAEQPLTFFDTDFDKNNNTLRLQSIQQGQINYVSEAENIKMFESDRPSPSFQGFLQMLYRNVCLSLNIPYGFAYDMQNLSGPTARLESAQAQRTFARWQMLLKSKVLNPIRNLVIAKGIAKKQIPNNPNWMSGKWMFPAHPTIDVGRESAANLNENRQGAKSLAEIYAEQGKDWEEELRQIAKEQSMIKDLAEEFSIDPSDIAIKTPNGNPVLSNPVQEKPDPEGKADMPPMKSEDMPMD